MSMLKQEVYKTISENEKITKLDLSKLLGKTERTIQRIASSLMKKGYLSRIGNNRFWYWKIINKITDDFVNVIYEKLRLFHFLI